MITSSGFALIRLSDHQIIGESGSLPWRVTVTDVGVCDFDAVGQVMPDADAPTHKLIERVTNDSPPGPQYTPTGSDVSYDPNSDRVIIKMIYPAQPNVVAPVEVIRTAYLKAALAQMNKLDVVEAAIQDPVLKALWDHATEMRRDDPDMIALAAALSIDIEAVWIAARAIREARVTS